MLNLPKQLSSAYSRCFCMDVLQITKKQTSPSLRDGRPVLRRLFCDRKNENDCNQNNTKKPTVSEQNNELGLTHAGLESKYKIFQEAEAPILLDVYEEKIILEQSATDLEKPEIDEYYGLSMKRGVRGVYDLEDLIQLLKRDKAEDLFVVELPAKADYVDHIVIVTGRSRRHMIALAEIVRKVFKKKRLATDILPHIEGGNSSTWIAMDLGNIALHIFSEEARKTYDLESLWSLGPEFDPLVNEPDDPLVALLKQHSIRVEDLASKGQLL